MAYLLDSDFVSPAVLTGFTRQALYDLTENQFQLARWLPNVTIDDVNFEFQRGGQGLVEVATYRSWDAESPIGRRESFGTVMGALPPISRKIPLNEYDRIRLRNADQAVLQYLTRDAERLAREVAARFEVARADAIFNGRVTINENGVQQTVDFGRDPAHSVTAGVAWSNSATATPLDDLEVWVQAYADKNGQAPGVILMTRQTFAAFRATEQVRGQVFPQAASAPIVSGDQARNVLASLDLPPIEIYNASTAVGRVTPQDKVALLPAPGAANAGNPNDLGATLLGTTVEAQDPDYGLAPGDQPGIVAATYRSTDPRRIWTHVVAIGLPILGNPDLTFVADVL